MLLELRTVIGCLENWRQQQDLSPENHKILQHILSEVEDGAQRRFTVFRFRLTGFNTTMHRFAPVETLGGVNHLQRPPVRLRLHRLLDQLLRAAPRSAVCVRPAYFASQVGRGRQGGDSTYHR